MREWCSECFLVVRLHVGTLLKKKSTWLLLTCSFLLLVLMLFCMDEAKEEKSRIAIGICDEDQSELSELLCRELEAMELYLVMTGPEQELTELLKKGKLSAVCVIKNGFEASVQKGKTDKLITIYETESGGALLLPDILAGVMMQDVCLAKSYELLSEYMEKSGREWNTGREEYRQFVKDTMEESNVNFSFDIRFVSTKTQREEEAPTQSMLYLQAIFAVFALLLGVLSIYAVLPFWDTCHGKTAGRLQVLPIKKGVWYIGSGIGSLLLPGGFGLLFGLCYAAKNSGAEMNFLSFLICTMAYLCVIVNVMLLAAYGIHSQMVYQMGMLAMMLVFGIFGLVSVVDGLFLPEGMTQWIPNGWYVRMLLESIQGG